MRHGSSCTGVRNVDLSSVMGNKAGLQPRGGGGGGSFFRVWPSSYRRAESRGAEKEKEKSQRSTSRIAKRIGCRTKGRKEIIGFYVGCSMVVLQFKRVVRNMKSSKAQ